MIFVCGALAADLVLAGVVAVLCARLRRLTERIAALTAQTEQAAPVPAEEREALERWNRGVAGVMAYEVRR